MYIQHGINHRRRHGWTRHPPIAGRQHQVVGADELDAPVRAQGAGTEARAEFQKILDHRGVLAPKDFNPVGMTLYPLAHIGRARAGRLTGELEESQKSYDALLAVWKDADADIPILRDVRRECGRLPSVDPSNGTLR
jgi:hypothetical protein